VWQITSRKGYLSFGPYGPAGSFGAAAGSVVETLEGLILDSLFGRVFVAIVFDFLVFEMKIFRDPTLARKSGFSGSSSTTRRRELRASSRFPCFSRIAAKSP
jgi:hypothetical protein